MVMSKDASHSLRSRRQTEGLAWARTDWIKFSVSGLKPPPIQRWDATGAVGLWWTDKTRRVDARHPASRKRTDQSQSTQDNEPPDWSLSDWENWLERDSDTDKEAESDSDLLS